MLNNNKIQYILNSLTIL